jgi:hypothetical protein
MPTAWMASKRVPRLATRQPSGPALQCSATPHSRTSPSRPVVAWVASVAPMTSGAVATMWRSCAAVPVRRRARRGGSGACPRIRRSARLRDARLRDARMPSIARGLAQALRWPSPVQGERWRSARMAASGA